MPKKKSNSNTILHMKNGLVYIDNKEFSVEIKEPIWLFKINQNFLLPGYRRHNKRVVYLDGHKVGLCDYREGCIPLEKYRITPDTFKNRLNNLFRENTGLLCKRSERGYYNISLSGNVYMVIVRELDDGYCRCVVHNKLNEEYIGDFIVDSLVSKVYPRLVVRELEKDFCIIIGYLLDYIIHSNVAKLLTRELEIKIEK